MQNADASLGFRPLVRFGINLDHTWDCPDPGEVDKAPRHRNIRDIHRPDLVRSRDLDAAQQIRIDLVAGLRLGRARMAVKRRYPHSPHQRLHVTAANLATLRQPTNLSCATRRMGRMLTRRVDRACSRAAQTVPKYQPRSDRTAFWRRWRIAPRQARLCEISTVR